MLNLTYFFFSLSVCCHEANSLVSWIPVCEANFSASGAHLWFLSTLGLRDNKMAMSSENW